MTGVGLRHGRELRVVAGGGRPQTDLGFVPLLLRLDHINLLGGFAGAADQQAGGQRVQRAGMPNLDGFELAFQLGHHIDAGPGQRLVHQQGLPVGQAFGGQMRERRPHGAQRWGLGAFLRH